MTMIRDSFLAADHRVALAVEWLRRRLGFRGAFLALLATLDLVWAYSLLDPAAARALKAAPTYHVIVAVAPLWVWGLLIGAIGVLCGIQCWMRDDRLAFGLAISWKLVWAALTLATWPTTGMAVLRATAVFLILGGIVSVCAAGLPFPED
jgi:hypothetical protein